MCGEDFCLSEKDKRDKVESKFLYAITDFSIFRKGKSYWLEYIGNDTYCGRSDNILNERVKISPFELYYYFSEDAPSAFEKCLSSWFHNIRTSQLLDGESIENLCDRNAIKATKMLMCYLTHK